MLLPGLLTTIFSFPILGLNPRVKTGMKISDKANKCLFLAQILWNIFTFCNHLTYIREEQANQKAKT